MLMFEHNYQELLRTVLEEGEHVEGRNGATRSVFGATLTFDDLSEGVFPILTTRRMYPNGIFGELAAFIRGATRLLEFKNLGCNYWDANAAAWPRNAGKEIGHQEVGKIYGAQWRNFNGYDQLKALVLGLLSQPSSRRHVLTSFNPAEVDQGCLPPCHLLVQYAVRDERYLHSCVYMRSVDLCVGLPTDVVLYAGLQVLLAHTLNLSPGSITFMMGDAHIYRNHFEGLVEQLNRRPSVPATYTVNPQLESIFDFRPSDITLDYNPQEPIQYEFNV